MKNIAGQNHIEYCFWSALHLGIRHWVYKLVIKLAFGVIWCHTGITL